MKRFLGLLLTLVLCISCMATFIGCSSDDTSEPDSVVDSTPPVPDEPYALELTSADVLLTENYEKLSLYDLKQADGNYARLFFKGVTIGNIVKTVIDSNADEESDSLIILNRYSDGSWRTLENGANKLDDVTNAIFEYVPFSGTGLGLNETQLTAYKTTKVADLMIKSLLGLNIGVDALFEQNVPDGMLELLKPVLYITVPEFNDLSLNGPAALVGKYAEIDVDSYISACFEFVQLSAGEKIGENESFALIHLEELLCDLLKGSIVNVTINGDLELLQFVTHAQTVLAQYVSDDSFDKFFDFLYANVSGTIAEPVFKAQEISKLVDGFCTLLPEETAAVVKKAINDNVGGTITEPDFNGKTATETIDAICADLKDVCDEDLLNATADLLKDIFACDTLTVKALVSDVQKLFDAVTTCDAVIDAVFGGFAELYGDAYVKDFASATGSLEISDVIDYFGDVMKAATGTSDSGKIGVVTDFLKKVLKGDVSHPKFDEYLLVSDLIGGIEDIITAFGGSPVPELDEISKLYGDIYVKDLGDEMANSADLTLEELDQMLFDGAIFASGMYGELKSLKLSEIVEYLNGGENAALDELLKSVKLSDLLKALGVGPEEQPEIAA